MKRYRGSASALVTNHSCCGVFSTAKSRHLPNFLLHGLGALRYIHKQGIVHRDVKLANILYKRKSRNADADFYLSDFGLVTHTVNARGQAGDPLYIAPELLDTGTVVWATPASDIYSFGIAILEFLGVVCKQEFKSAESLWRTKLANNSSPTDYRDVQWFGMNHFGHSRIQSLRARGLLRNPVLESMLDPIPGNRPSAGQALHQLARFYNFAVPPSWDRHSNPFGRPPPPMFAWP